MVCAQVFGNDTTISFVGSQGHFQLNVFNPVMVANFLQSAQLLGDACVSFDEHCATGIQPNYPRIKQQLENSLMLVTHLIHTLVTKMQQKLRKLHTKMVQLYVKKRLT